MSNNIGEIKISITQTPKMTPYNNVVRAAIKEIKKALGIYGFLTHDEFYIFSRIFGIDIENDYQSCANELIKQLERLVSYE